MSASLKPLMTMEEFLLWEGEQAFKFEFDGFRPMAMTGGSAAHAGIQRNLLGVLYNALRGHQCRAYGSELKIEVAGSIRYPDAFIVRTPVPPRAQVVTDPVVVFEILSPATASTDWVEKNREYRDTPSVRRYVILEQTRMAAAVFSRDSGTWTAEFLVGDAELVLPEAGIAISLTDLYEGALSDTAQN
jgi:Uma2 family endonuclease